MRDARALGLDMRRLRFVVGYFNESLPQMVAAEPDLRFAVVRLVVDGTSRESERCAPYGVRTALLYCSCRRTGVL